MKKSASSIKRKRFRPISLQIVISILAVMGIAVFAIAYFSYNQTAKLLTDNAFRSMENELIHQQIILRERIEIFRNNIRFLADVPSIQGIIHARGPGGPDPDEGSSEGLLKQQLARIFTILLKSRPEYRRISLIGEKNRGRELIRVEKIPQGLRKVEAVDLKQYEGEPLFIETLRLREGQVFLSEFVLDTENNRIVTPHRLLVRMTTPIYDAKTGNVFGIVCIDVDMTMVFSATFFGPKSYSFEVSDQSGYYLHLQDPEKRFGFVLKHASRMQNDYPEVEEFFKAENEVRAIHNVFTRRYDLRRKNEAIVLSAFHFDPRVESRFIMLSLITDRGMIFERSRIFRNQIVLLSSAVALLLTCVAFWNTNKIVKPITALTRFSREAAAGKIISSGIRPARNDEIGELTEAFNAMTATIERNNIELAEKIELRTRELRKFQEKLLQAEKLSSLGQLGAGVAHELNSPLTGILGLIRSYKKEKAPESEERKDLEEIEKACAHMSGIIRELNDFSRQSAGDVEPVDCNDIIDTTLTFSAHELGKKGIAIEKDYTDILAPVMGNRNQLQQVVLNIVMNARDATSRDGVFRIATKNIRSGPERFVEMNFTDSGSGIKEELVKKIFDPFYTTKRPGGGVGLGLSVAHNIITNHRGTISVTSTPGSGTTFTITLPAM